MRISCWPFWILILSWSALGSIEQAPPSFPHREGKAVFIDLLSARYSLIYDLSSRTITANSELVFKTREDGYPIYDLVPEPIEESIDGQPTHSELTPSPDSYTKFRVLSKRLKKGVHRLKVSHRLAVNSGVFFQEGNVDHRFGLSDRSGRNFLEAYLPSNYEFDQFPGVLDVRVAGAQVPHLVRANGKISKIGKNRFRVVFPSWYTTSSFFFHLSAFDAYLSEKFDYESVDGRMIPVEIYRGKFGDALPSIVIATKFALTALEQDYGPFPHPSLIIYGGGGGMEYAGAITGSLILLRHELFHQYNARSVMPANGNAGWMDEALSSWMDRGYLTNASSLSPLGNMDGRSPYARGTDPRAYEQGEYFMRWIAKRLKDQGQDLKLFLREYFAKRAHTTVTTDDFRGDLEEYTGLSFVEEFKYLQQDP